MIIDLLGNIIYSSVTERTYAYLIPNAADDLDLMTNAPMSFLSARDSIETLVCLFNFLDIIVLYNKCVLNRNIRLLTADANTALNIAFFSLEQYFVV